MNKYKCLLGICKDDGLEDKEVKINMNIGENIKICPYCLGTGKLKAMQSIATNTGSVRSKDKQVKCRFCNGTGLNN